MTILSIRIEPAYVLLTGVFIGVFATLAVQYYWTRRLGSESRPILLARHNAYVKEMGDNYEALLTGILAIQRTDGADISNLEKARSIVMLRGSTETKRLLLQFINMSPDDRIKFNTGPLVDAIHTHITELLADSP
jgi:hypothetical protein